MVAYTDVVILELQAKLDRYNSEIASGQRRFDSAMNNMGRSLKSMEARTATSFRNAASAVRGFYGFLAGAAVVQVARGYTQLADSATRMSNSLRIAGLEGDELKRVYAELYSAAQRNSTPIASLVDLYSKLSLSQSALGVTSQELMEFTDGIAVALRVAGTDATAAGGALLQLSQALGGGVVRAEEFNSMLEGTPTIVQAVARGLKEANGSVAELRKLVNEGKVSSTAFFRAFQAGSELLREQAASSQTTVGQAFTRLGNSLVTVVGEFDKATGASSAFADGISKLSDGLDSFDVSGFVAEIQRIIDKFLEAEQAGTNWLNDLGNSAIFQGGDEEWFNTVVSPETGEAEEKIAALERDIEILQAGIERNTELGMDNTEAMARLAELKAELAAVQAMAANLPRYFPGANMITQGTFIGAEGYQPPPAAPEARPSARPADLVSIEDHPTAPSSGTGGRGRRGGGGRSGGRGRGRSFDLEEELRQLQKRTDLINAETEALSKLDPLAEDYETQMDKIRVEQELLNEAQAAGVALSPDVRAGISTMAEAYAQAEEQARKLKEAQDEIKDRHQEWIDTQKDAMKGFIQDLSAGKSAAEALAGALQKVADKLLDIAVDNLFSSGGGGGGFLGNLFGFLFGKRAQGGPARKGLPYLVNENTPNSEVFVPSESGGVLNVPQAQEALAKAARVSSEYGSGRQAQPSPSRMTVKTEANFTFNLEGANGDKAIEDAVNRGIRQAAPILRDQAVKESVQTVGRMSRDGSKSFLGIR